ncbi:MAG: LacI family DNA-binding transcriptional regulator [Anaerolineaceae bacterium]
MNNLTLEDIAEQAGVSRSTVSRVVNNQTNVSEKVRQRVLNVIQDTNFSPNAAAQALASQRSWTIGLVLPLSVSFFFTDPYYPNLTRGIAQACNQNNYTLAFFLVSNAEDEENMYPRIARKGFLDGVVVQSGHHGDQGIIGKMIDMKIPMVVIGRPFRSDNVTYVDIDNTYSAYGAVSHLIQLGHKRIGTITGPNNSTVGIDRLEGYRKALTERALPYEEALVVEGDFTEASGYYAMQKMLSAQPDAVFAASDVMAMGAMRAINDAKLTIPEDIALVGFDDLPMSSFSNIQLTTIRQPVVQSGIRTVETLLDLIENGIQQPRHIIMDTELIIRDSCGANRKILG